MDEEYWTHVRNGGTAGHDDPRRPGREGSSVAEPRSGDDLAQPLMEKAAGDEKILIRLIDDDDIPNDGLGFTAQ
jgi:hypothetical protein